MHHREFLDNLKKQDGSGKNPSHLSACTLGSSASKDTDSGQCSETQPHHTLQLLILSTQLSFRWPCGLFYYSPMLQLILLLVEPHWFGAIHFFYSWCLIFAPFWPSLLSTHVLLSPIPSSSNKNPKLSCPNCHNPVTKSRLWPIYQQLCEQAQMWSKCTVLPEH